MYLIKMWPVVLSKSSILAIERAHGASVESDAANLILDKGPQILDQLDEVIRIMSYREDPQDDANNK